ncbi:hypothetical protein ABMA27_012935 [Loxostege sticticalis]|uniref:Uncharacterized protein n=1 Tax=Loxostege sticticalis TaxID=481309 RepID=A0ABR3H0A8_LOXSC
MTVRLSALFESLWSRSPASPAPARHTRRTRHSRRQRSATEAMNGNHDPSTTNNVHHSDESSSESETLAATSRRVHARAARGSRDSWDSDAPLHTHTKGKGVGKKSKSSSNSNEPVAGTSGVQHVSYAQTNGLPSGSEGEALLEAAEDSNSDSDSPEYQDIQVVEEELAEDELELTYEEPEEVLERRRVSDSGSGSSLARRWRHKPHHTKRTRERFTSVSSQSSNSSAYSAPDDARRYESDHSYRPRYSTDDDAPLHLYRQRQEGGGEAARAGPSSGRRHNGHARGVKLRARRSPRQYNEDSEEDSVAAISKRSQHHHQQQRRQQQQQHRRQHHAAQVTEQHDPAVQRGQRGGLRGRHQQAHAAPPPAAAAPAAAAAPPAAPRRAGNGAT